MLRSKPLRSNPVTTQNWINRSRSRIPKVSKKRKKQANRYQYIAAEYVAKHPICECCLARIAAGEDIQPQRSRHNHHKRGRVGRLICDTRFFCAVCPSCHPAFVHVMHVAKARELGILSEPQDWNVYPPA